jgi:hypothetical protein
MIADSYNMMLDTGFWILDGIRNVFSLSSIEHPATSISTPQATNLINAHKLVGLRPWLR